MIFRVVIIPLMIGVVAVAMTCLPAAAEDDGTAAQPEPVVFQRVAVASFLVGRHKPHMDESMDLTLSCPIGEICKDDPTILPHAGITLTRLVSEKLHSRFTPWVVGREQVQAAEMQMALDQGRDTPIDLARRLGRLVEAEVVIIGIVWRYRERGAVAERPDGGASVAFAIYAVEAATGRFLWREIYDATQQTVLEDLFQARKQIRMGLRWLNADELAAHGVGEVLRKWPDHLRPVVDPRGPQQTDGASRGAGAPSQ